MRFTVTALGATGGRTVAAVVADIVRYLKERPDQSHEATPPPAAGASADGVRADGGRGEPSRYYADEGERSGRWLGQGAPGLDLHGDVDAHDFRRVLGGRHPRTGGRLISARGSAGRVADLGAGTVAGYAPDGEALYGVADVATVLRWSQADVADAAAEGHRLAAGRLFAVLAGTGTGQAGEAGPAGTGMELVPFVGRDGTVLVRDSELERVEVLVSESRSVTLADGTSSPDEILNAAEAARLIGTSRSYVARLCRTWEEHRDDIEAAADARTSSRRVPLTNVENACASGGTALHLASSAVRFGQYDTVLVVGAERMRVPDKALAFQALSGAMDVEDPLPLPPDAVGKRSPFMDVYATRARRLMSEYGVTTEGFALVATKAWRNGSRNDLAQRRTVVDVDDVLASRPIVDPLTVDMCALTGDGAAAAVLRSEPRRRPGDVRIRASQLRTLSGAPADPSAATAAATAAYEESGLSPADVDVAEVHDATAPGEMISWVGTLLCTPGDEEKWARSGHTEIGGPLPVNPSGGLIARGHPIGASGVAQAYELVQQLRGRCGDRQVERAATALAHVGGGVLAGTQTAVSSVHLLSAD